MNNIEAARLAGASPIEKARYLNELKVEKEKETPKVVDLSLFGVDMPGAESNGDS